MGHLRLPAGKRIAVNMGVDFDAQSIWLGSFNTPSPAYMARGEFGAEVGVPRLLKLFAKYGIKTTFFTPGHTIETWPDICKQIQAEGHEVAHHGYYHENPTKIEASTERKLMELALDAFDRHLQMRPVGYRSPYWDYSESTLDLIEEYGFLYDSSLMARDLEAYRPRRWQVNWERGSVKGKASALVELPTSWYLDDFPPLAYITGGQAGQQDTDTVFRRWRDIFDYAHQNVPNGWYGHAVHPQIIGQPHHIMTYERLLAHIGEHDDVWSAPAKEIAATWVDDADDTAAMNMDDIRGVEPAPADSGFPSLIPT